MSRTKKLRLSLSPQDILHIIQTLRYERELTPESYNIIAYLEPLLVKHKLKIEYKKLDMPHRPGALRSKAPSTSEGTPFSATNPNPSLIPAESDITNQLNKLTSLHSLTAVTTNNTLPAKQKDKKLYWEQCYNKLQESGADTLSSQEMEAANEWRYINDLMTEQEEKEHEIGL